MTPPLDTRYSIPAIRDRFIVARPELPYRRSCLRFAVVSAPLLGIAASVVNLLVPYTEADGRVDFMPWALTTSFWLPFMLSYLYGLVTHMCFPSMPFSILIINAPVTIIVLILWNSFLPQRVVESDPTLHTFVFTPLASFIPIIVAIRVLCSWLRGPPPAATCEPARLSAIFNATFSRDEVSEDDGEVHEAWRMSSPQCPTVIHEGWQLLFMFAWLTLSTSTYVTLALIAKQKASSEIGGLLLLVFFNIVAQLCSSLFKVLGKAIDAGKVGDTCSAWFASEVVAGLFQYVWYRVLFQQVELWSSFVAFQAVHVLFDWLTYPLRATDAYYRCVTDFTSRHHSCFRSLVKSTLLVTEDGVSCWDWKCFVSLDMGVQIYVKILTLAGYILNVNLVMLGPNRSHFALPDVCKNRILQHNLFCFGMLFVEGGNFLVMDWLFFRPRRLSPVRRLPNVMSDCIFLGIMTLSLAVEFASLFVPFERRGWIFAR